MFCLKHVIRFSILLQILLFSFGNVVGARFSMADHHIGQSIEHAPPACNAAGKIGDETDSKSVRCINNNVPSEKTPADSAWSSQGDRRRSCVPVIPASENLLERFVRIFFGPDWCGPDPDVDTNISAGGAAGG
jgi:hypothetical protein